MKRVLVTGASGFIGRHLCRALIKDGWQVTAAARNEVSAEKIRNHLAADDAAGLRVVIAGDIDGTTTWTDALRGADAVIHAAARVHQAGENQEKNKSAYYATNCDATQNLARQAAAAGVRHFVFLSSVLAVCSKSDSPLTETTACRPDSVYGRSKLAAEQALMNTAGKKGMAYTILRLPLVYGPGNVAGMERLIRLVSSGMPLPFKSIRSRRSFLYIENLNDAILNCLKRPEARNRVFMLRDDEDLSVPSLAALIATCLGRRPLQFPAPAWMLRLTGHTGERLLCSLYVDDALIRSSLSWRPPFSAREGFTRTVS